MHIKQWFRMVNEIGACRICQNDPIPVAEKDSFPVFLRQNPGRTDILFIGESPTFNDTFQSGKKYISINSRSEPAGRFLYKLLTQILELEENEFCYTNSVLCLPKFKANAYPVGAQQIINCSPHLKRMITELSPKIVCTLGMLPLNAIKKIENHGITDLHSSAAKEIKWFNRILFPLFSTNLKTRFGADGRTKNEQIEDWKKLRMLYEDICRD